MPLAPLHNPVNLLGIRAARRALPDVAQVAVFDTAFHATLPMRAATYAVPASWRTDHAVRRYGFHGTSHAYVSRRTARAAGPAARGHQHDRAAPRQRRERMRGRGGTSVDTSMGLTPLAGLVMGTRSGDVDPALPAHLGRVAGLTADGR